MSFPVEVLIQQIVGMLEEGDVAEFLGPEYPHLSETLGKVRKGARGLVKGWAVNTVTSPGECGVGIGGGPVLCQPPQPADPGLVQAPGKHLPTGGLGEARGGASGPSPGPVRAARLLGAFTKKILNKRKNALGPSPPKTLPQWRRRTRCG